MSDNTATREGIIELPAFTPFGGASKPAHGEYLVLLHKEDGEEDGEDYVCIANYTYRDGGNWHVEGVKGYITKQVAAWMEPRFAHDYMLSPDE